MHFFEGILETQQWFLPHSVIQISFTCHSIQCPGVSALFQCLLSCNSFMGVELLEILKTGSISKAASVQKELPYHWFHHLNSERITEKGKYIQEKLESKRICSSKLLMPVDLNALLLRQRRTWRYVCKCVKNSCSSLARHGPENVM